MPTENETLRHAAAWLRYERSPRFARDMAADKLRRKKRDRAAGHLPQCSLAKCAPECPSLHRDSGQ